MSNNYKILESEDAIELSGKFYLADLKNIITTATREFEERKIKKYKQEYQVQQTIENKIKTNPALDLLRVFGKLTEEQQKKIINAISA